jgi:uncharacterized membrane protein YraQ (UPF0718 family)
MNILQLVQHALSMAFGMGWEILWPLVLGFALSGAIQAVVSHDQMSKLLPDDKPKTLAIASLLGAASSSCSYAAVALSRSIFRKGGNFSAAMAFEMASTNLVVELGIIMALLLGWRFTAAEFIGGPIMIIILALLLRIFIKPKLIEAAHRQAEKGVAGKMEGHAGMGDMSVQGDGTLLQRLLSSNGRTATSHYFVMDWASVWTDIVLGLLIAGAIAAWVPMSFFQQLFLASHHTLSVIWGPIIGPLLAVVTFVCSVGNVPLAAVLWNSGISFGGVVSFIFADLIIIPILIIYRKYYGTRMMVILSLSMYLSMVLAGYAVEFIFYLLRLTPVTRDATVLDPSISLNYTTYLNIIFLILAAAMVWRFLRTGGPAMLKMMNSHDEDMAHDHSHH